MYLDGVFVCNVFSRISKNLSFLCAKKANKELKVHLTGHGERVLYAAESRHFVHGIQTSNSCQQQSFLARAMNLFGESQTSVKASKTKLVRECQNSLRGAIALLVNECHNNSNYPLYWEVIKVLRECENHHVTNQFTRTEQKNCKKKHTQNSIVHL